MGQGLRRPEKTVYPQELELQTVTVTTTQVLGTKPGSSQSTPGALNQLTISPAPTLIFLFISSVWF